MFKKVACAVSGGVDSAVCLHLLKKRGFDCCGVYMQNWDSFDEIGQCPTTSDEADARRVCAKMNVPFFYVNFIKEYWHDVFTYMIKSVERGLCPNPDIMCNKHIKFDSFFNYARSVLQADAIATGHYARCSFGEYLEKYSENADAKLYRPADKCKDQTLFLSQIPRNALRRTMFPLASMEKPQVRKIAEEIGLDFILQKRESVGICMIGKREFGSFVDQYIEPRVGNIVEFGTGNILGTHPGLHHFIVGQRMNFVSGGRRPYFVSKKLLRTNEIIVSPGTNHESLFTLSMQTASPYWLCDESKVAAKEFTCKFKYRHAQVLLMDCKVGRLDNSGLSVVLDVATRAVNPGQFGVFYLDDECLGSAEILAAGPSLSDERKRQQLKKAQSEHFTSNPSLTYSSDYA